MVFAVFGIDIFANILSEYRVSYFKWYVHVIFYWIELFKKKLLFGNYLFIFINSIIEQLLKRKDITFKEYIFIFAIWTLLYSVLIINIWLKYNKLNVLLLL